MNCVLHTTYLGPVGWYAALLSGEAEISDGECYRRQTERNRCNIATANGVQQLTVPVTLPSRQSSHCMIRDVRISDHGNWQRQHWQALQSAYGMSPFFDYFADDLHPFYEKKWEWLFDYNNEITSTVLQLFGVDSTVEVTDSAAVHPCSEFSGKVGEYYQTFKRRHGFLDNLSIIDLLCNEGPEGVLKLQRGYRRSLQG